MYEGSLEERLENTSVEDIVEAISELRADKIKSITESLSSVSDYNGTMIAEMLLEANEKSLKEAMQLLKDKGAEPWKNLQ